MIEQDKKINLLLEKFSKRLPHFSDGRINYSSSNEAPVLVCFVMYKDKILILKRSNKVDNYQGKWNTVTGYLDEFKPLKEKVTEELNEELGISKNNILKMTGNGLHEIFDQKLNKTWLAFPVMVEIKKPKIKIDWEHIEYKWINTKDLLSYDVVYKLDESLEKVINRFY